MEFKKPRQDLVAQSLERWTTEKQVAGSIPGAEPGGVLPYKGLMGTCGQPRYVFRDFCLNQGIDFINFCLKQGIFSWTINSLRLCSTNVLNRVSKIGILS